MSRRLDIRKLAPVAIAFAATVALVSAPAAGAKTISITKAVNAPIPDATPPPPMAGLVPRPGILLSSIDVGKLGKAKKVRDVNLTVQTAGTAGTTPAADLNLRLTGPVGAQTLLFDNLAGLGGGTPNLSIGPLTLDDEARLNLGEGNPVNPNYLYAPWAGAATPGDPFAVFNRPLAVFDNGPGQGTWTLAARDEVSTETSNLVSWTLNLVTGKPFKTKQ
jgi:hypothetical protein